MSRRLILLTLATILVAGLISAGAGAGRTQGAARSFSVGLYDDSMTLGAPEKGFPILHNLRAQVVRITLWWGGSSGVAKTKRRDGLRWNCRVTHRDGKRNVAVRFQIAATLPVMR